jgi:hypothetical protein
LVILIPRKKEVDNRHMCDIVGHMKNKFNCPICQVEMVQMYGNAIHPNDPAHGVLLRCINKECSAQEVEGHGDKVKDAYETVMHKYAGGYKKEK